MIRRSLVTTICFALLLPALLLAAEEAGDNIPGMKEFHEVMAKMWHTYYPANDWAAVRKDLGALQERAKKLQETKLTGAMAAKQETFDKNVAELLKQIDLLAAACQKDNDENVKQGVFDVHMAFHDMISALYAK
ncbi:MAG TPA: hypothetical protein PK961_12275 [bacterium]|nr:hypothetical protein [bacterium]